MPRTCHAGLFLPLGRILCSERKVGRKCFEPDPLASLTEMGLMRRLEGNKDEEGRDRP